MNWSFLTNNPIVRAFGSIPSTLPNKRTTSSLEDDRQIPSDPLADWWLSIPQKIPPKEIEMILRQAQAGSIWQFSQLVQKMRDTWPMFASKSFELRSAIAGANFTVVPYTEAGEEISKSAQDKADFIRRCLVSFKPSRFKDEDGFKGMIFDLTDAILIGVSIVELLWDEDFLTADGQKEKNVRASGWVHPRHYSFQGDGSIGIAPTEQSQWLQFPTPMNKAQPMLTEGDEGEHKFLIAKFKAKSGSPTGAGFGRVLAFFWVNIVYGHDFLLNFAQKYGNPFMDIPYQSGISESEIVKFQNFAKKAANQGFIVHPNTGEVKITPAQGMGNENPQVVLARMADEACQMVLLGQTLTSSAPTNGGTRAQGDVHADVKSEKIEGLVKWVAEILTEQLVESLLIKNYGESSERPTIVPDMTTPLDAMEQAQFLTAISTCTVPLPVADTYKKMGIPAPNTGDHVLVGGKIGILGDTETEIDANPQPPPPPEFGGEAGAGGYGEDQSGSGGDESGQEDSQEDQSGNQDDNAEAAWTRRARNVVQANRKPAKRIGEQKQLRSGLEKTVSVNIRSLLAKATPAQAAQLKMLVAKAKSSTHLNGEVGEIKNLLKAIEKQ